MEEFSILTEIIKDLYGIDKEQLIAKCRKRDLVELRYVCANILRSETKYTVEAIGENLNIDHSTVCYAVNEHVNLMQSKNSTNKPMLLGPRYLISSSCALANLFLLFALVLSFPLLE